MPDLFFSVEQYPLYDEGRIQVLIVSPTPWSRIVAAERGETRSGTTSPCSASAPYASSASSTRGSRAQQMSCVVGQASESGPHDFPHESVFPALGTTKVGACDISAAGLQQQKTIAAGPDGGTPAHTPLSSHTSLHTLDVMVRSAPFGFGPLNQSYAVSAQNSARVSFLRCHRRARGARALAGRRRRTDQPLRRKSSRCERS